MEERRERLKDWIFRLSVVAVMMILTIIAISFSGCSQGATNITGPSPTTTTTILDSSNDEDLKLVKQYNSDLSGGKATRWNKSIVTVYDSTGKVNLQSVLNEWNAVLAGKLTLAVGGQGSDIEIVRDDSVACGVGGYYPYNGIIIPRGIRISQTCLELPYDANLTAEHEIGHVIGFFGHTNSGVMSNNAHTITSQITSEISRMLNKLYSIELGAQIV